MARLTPGISLGLILALAPVAKAKTVSIDFTGASPVSQGLTEVNNGQTKDGATVIVQRGGMNVAMTGNSDSNHYLYLAIDPAFKQGLQHVWLTVTYFDAGTDGFQIQYDGLDDPHQSPADLPTRSKFDTKQFTHQTWHLTRFNLAGGEEGGADLRWTMFANNSKELPSNQDVALSPTGRDDFNHKPAEWNRAMLDPKP